MLGKPLSAPIPLFVPSTSPGRDGLAATRGGKG